ncbi:hypothetical protein ABIF53_007937 [Bradyrhizobium japonicum]
MICHGAVMRCTTIDSAKGQHLRRLEDGDVERRRHRGDLGVAEGAQEARQLLVQGGDGLSDLEYRSDRIEVLDHVGRADAGQRARLVAAARPRQLEDGVRSHRLELLGERFDLPRTVSGRHARQRRLEFVQLVRSTVTAEPLPDRMQRGAADLSDPDRGARLDEERFQHLEQEPRQVVRPRGWGFVGLRLADDPAQLLEHEGRHSRVLAALERALELPHQQRLRLRRELREIFPQPLDRCLAHAPR